MTPSAPRRLKKALFRLALHLPPGLRRLASSPATRGLRDRFFRPGGETELVRDTIHWMDLVFPFTAPYQVLERARTRGVENRICRLARSVLEPGDLAVDVGANYGFVSLVAAHAVAPDGKVISFEIVPAVRAAMQSSVDAAGLSAVVHLVDRGAGDVEKGDLTTVDAALEAVGAELERFKFLKIDVDGLDFAVLRGAARSLRAAKPAVVIEMTRDGAEIFELLKELGYTHFMDQDQEPVDGSSAAGPSAAWPENLIASCEPLRIPPPS